MAIHRNTFGKGLELRKPMLEEILDGLKATPKSLPAKYFYDQTGAELFEQICELKEYYPTRTEVAILRNSIPNILEYLERPLILYEMGSGSSTKTQIILSQVPNILGYVPIDICPEYLSSASQRLKLTFPKLKIAPICSDFTQDLEFQDEVTRTHQNALRLAFFPGSTIGNLTPVQARRVLNSLARALGPDGKLLIGVDLLKDVSVLENAYNDSLGITEKFNLNILDRMNRELGANFDVKQFRHLAFFNPKESRIEMHLVCLRNSLIEFKDHSGLQSGGHRILIEAGEKIHTENSYKYDPNRFIALASESGFDLVHYWQDERKYFGVFLLSVAK